MANSDKRTRRPNPRFNTGDEEVEAPPGTASDKEEPPTKKPKKLSERVNELEASLSKQEEKLTEVLDILKAKFAAEAESASPGDAQKSVKPKEDDPMKIMERVLGGELGEEEKRATTMSPMVSAISPQLRKEIWAGDFFDLTKLMDKHTSNRRVTMDVSGSNIAVDIQAGAAPKYTFPEWKQAFFKYSMCLAYQEANEAQHLMVYAHSIEKMATTYGDTAWYRYDIEFRKQKRDEGWSWSAKADRLFMETIAQVLISKDKQSFRNNQHRQGAPSNSTPSKQSYHSLSEEAKALFNLVPAGYCRRYATGICENTEESCRFVHRCFKCQSQHAAITCRNRNQQDRAHKSSHTNKGK